MQLSLSLKSVLEFNYSVSFTSGLLTTRRILDDQRPREQISIASQNLKDTICNSGRRWGHHIETMIEGRLFLSFPSVLEVFSSRRLLINLCDSHCNVWLRRFRWKSTTARDPHLLCVPAFDIYFRLSSFFFSFANVSCFCAKETVRVGYSRRISHDPLTMNTLIFYK